MNKIDQIPWRTLRHAYGTAEDVPDLIRQLASAATANDALKTLFGNIWHQGTIYEATSYAVPFLVELAVNEETPNRVGILNLLEEITHGNSFLEAHASFFKQVDVSQIGSPGSAQYEEKRNEELQCVERARAAVRTAFDQLVGLAGVQTNIAYAALAVLARLKIRQPEVRSLISEFLESEKRDAFRGGLLLLIGELGVADESTRKAIEAGACSAAQLERVAAGIAACRLCHGEFTPTLCEAIIEGLCIASVELLFDELPWNVGRNIDSNRGSLLPLERTEAANRLLSRIQTSEPTEDLLNRLGELAFPRTASEFLYTDKSQLSDLQRRVVQTFIDRFDKRQRPSVMRTNIGYGLPETWRELRGLVTGVPVKKLNENYPDIAFADNPLRPRRISSFKIGDRIHSRYFGLGTVIDTVRRRRDIYIGIDFDEEGLTTLSFRDSIVVYAIDLGLYYLTTWFEIEPSQTRSEPH